MLGFAGRLPQRARERLCLEWKATKVCLMQRFVLLSVRSVKRGYGNVVMYMGRSDDDDDDDDDDGGGVCCCARTSASRLMRVVVTRLN